MLINGYGLVNKSKNILPKVLITDYVHPVLPSTLQKHGFEVVYDETMNNDKLLYCIHEFTGLVINSKMTIDKPKIDLATQLKWVARLGSGLEIIDVPYCNQKNIRVVNSPEGNCHAVAEHEIGMLLALCNNLLKADREVRNFVWDREGNRGIELRGKTLGIIGLGHTGSALAEKMSSWGLSVIYYDKYKERIPASLRFVKKVGLEELQRRSDIISLHVPLTDETKQWIDKFFLQKCKDGVIISNTSRGQVCHTRDLIEALQSGKVYGACLDVFENEKPGTFTESEKEMYRLLYSMQNVVLSPHIAGWTKESLYYISAFILQKLGYSE